MILILGGLLVFLAVALDGFRTLRIVQQETSLRAQARENLLKSRTVLSLLKDVETGQRGFILTGDAHYLAPYSTGMRDTWPAFEDLLRALRPAELAANVSEGLGTLIAQRLEVAQRNVETRKAEGFAAAQAAILSDEGRRLMEDIRLRFAELDGLLRAEIARHNDVVVEQTRRAQWFSALMTIVGVLMIVLAYALLLREAGLRERAERALHEANGRLEGAVAARTAELQHAREEIEAFAVRLDRDIESERRRLAREVHDQLGQVFTALRMVLDGSFRTAPGNPAVEARVNRLLDDGIATTRRIAAELRPPLLEDLGFVPALTYLAQRFSEESGIPIELRLDDSGRLVSARSLQLYRIAQESLTNIARHAHASQIWIAGVAENDRYTLIIEDDGRGMARPLPVSQGLSSMRERAALAGGMLRFETGRTDGVRVIVEMPLGEGEHG